MGTILSLKMRKIDRAPGSVKLRSVEELGASAGDEETGQGFLFSPTLEVFI